MEIQYYIKKFKEVRKSRFKRFEKKHKDFLNKYSDFYQNNFVNRDFSNLEWKDVEEIAENTHSFHALALAKAMAINEDNNDIATLITQFTALAKPLQSKIKEAKYKEIAVRLNNALSELKYWGISSISEVIGQCHPNDFVFYNLRNREAIKFLEIDIKDKKYYRRGKKGYGSNIANYYVAYQKAVEDEVTSIYKKLIWNELGNNSKHDICIEVDQFFSWVYDIHIKDRGHGNNQNEHQEDKPIISSHIKKIIIKDYYTLKDIQIDDINSKEVYILGENGTGKTLFLQAILLATKWQSILDQDYQSTAIVRDQLKNAGKDVEFIIQDENPDLKEDDIQTFFVLSNKETFQWEYELGKIETLNTQEFKNEMQNIFAYGVNRNTDNNTKDPKKRFEFLSLFGEQSTLINPIDWLTKLFIDENINSKNTKTESKIPLKEAKKLIETLLNDSYEGENGGNIKIQVDYETVDFMFNNKELTFEQLSDGYKSVFIWIVDLIARLSKNQPNIKKLENFGGVVLVDELDLFLHPRWAEKIVGNLREKLPKIQFFITTHSPILTLGASKNAAFYKLYKENGVTKISNRIKLPSMTANSWITSSLWNLESFTTANINPEDIIDGDNVTLKIRQVMRERLKKIPYPLIDEELIRMIEEEFDRLEEVN